MKYKYFAKKLRMVDLIFVMILVVASVFSLFFFNRKKEYIYVDITDKREGWQPYPIPAEIWQINNINIGDKVYNSLGTNIAEVTDIEKTYWGAARSNSVITLKMQVLYNTNAKTYTYEGNPLLINQDISINIGKTKFTGKVLNVYTSPERRYAKYKKAVAEITVKYRNYENWHAEAIRNFTVKNSKGEVILSTKNIQIEPAEIVVSTNNGEVLRRFSPLKKDVIITFVLNRVLCDEDTCFFNYFQPLKIGVEFWANSDLTFVGPADSGDSTNTSHGSIMNLKINYLN
jgi:hypothetical protein